MSEESSALPPEFAPEPLWYNLATDIGQVLHDEHGMPPQSARNIEELASALSSVEMLWWHSRTRQTNSSTMPLRSLEKLLKSTNTLQKMAKSPSLADVDARRRLALAWAKLQGKVGNEDIVSSWLDASDRHADWQVIHFMEKISDAVKLAIRMSEDFSGGSYSVDLVTELSKIYAEHFPANPAARLDFVNLASTVIAKKSFTRKNTLNQALKRAR